MLEVRREEGKSKGGGLEWRSGKGRATRETTLPCWVVADAAGDDDDHEDDEDNQESRRGQGASRAVVEAGDHVLSFSCMSPRSLPRSTSCLRHTMSRYAQSSSIDKHAYVRACVHLVTICLILIPPSDTALR